jgi:hypothetical protein
MLRSYKKVSTDHSKLNQFIIGFFNRIENESGPFEDLFFGHEFLKIVNHHPKILKTPCKLIYFEINNWPHNEKTKLCEQIRQSNDIINICAGNYKPTVILAPSKKSKPKSLPKAGKYTYEDILKVLRELFIKLYEQVLDGKAFRDAYSTTLRIHFDVFRKANENITICPLCGISELKTEFDKSRDQYDHYLPKSLYPFSAVNFDNLVPICKECNGLDVKADKNVIEDFSGKLFFPYDTSHKGIKIDFKITQDDPDIHKIEWGISYSNPDAKNAEIESWKEIYNIDERYIGFIRGRIKKWYECKWLYLNSKKFSLFTLAEREMFYMGALDFDEKLELSFLRKPALEAFLSDSPMAKAQTEASFYSS